MGYNATYSGIFRFSQPVTGPELARLNIILNKDIRKMEHPQRPPDLYYIDLNLTSDYTGLVWNGSESSVYYAGMTEAVNFIVPYMREQFPHFGLTGSMEGTGEDGERWKTVIGEDGTARELRAKIVYEE